MSSTSIENLVNDANGLQTFFIAEPRRNNLHCTGCTISSFGDILKVQKLGTSAQASCSEDRGLILQSGTKSAMAFCGSESRVADAVPKGMTAAGNCLALH